MLTTFDHYCLDILFLRIKNFSTLFFSHKFQFCALFSYLRLQSLTTWPIRASLILFALKLCEICQLSHMLCHNVIFCQYSLSHQCSHPPAIATTLWSLVQSFLGSYSSLLAFIHRRLLPSPTFCIIYYTLCLAHSTFNMVNHGHF